MTCREGRGGGGGEEEEEEEDNGVGPLYKGKHTED